MNGFVNSFQSMGAVDGPGLRFVVFLQGCPLRCIYCHNPETWDCSKENSYSSDSIVQKALRYKTYFGKEGGVTVSGGEALLQSEFVAELFEKLKKADISTALDTSGIGDLRGAEKVLKFTDLVICDIKFSTEEMYQKYCNGSLERVQSFLKLSEKNNVPLWIRNVIVPNLTDNEDSLRKIINIASKYNNLKKIELLPFKKLCVSKYENLGINFLLNDVPECDDKTIESLKKFIPEQFK